MTRDLGLMDCSRIIAALEHFADDLDYEDSIPYTELADEIASCDRVILVPLRQIEGVGE